MLHDWRVGKYGANSRAKVEGFLPWARMKCTSYGDVMDILLRSLKYACNTPDITKANNKRVSWFAE